jgi:hypothetical protein
VKIGVIGGNKAFQQSNNISHLSFLPRRSGGGGSMEYDKDKVDEAVLALLYLTLHDVSEYGGRAWKGLDWDALDRLHKRGLIGDPRSKAKSVVLDSDGVRAAERAFRKKLGKAG